MSKHRRPYPGNPTICAAIQAMIARVCGWTPGGVR